MAEREEDGELQRVHPHDLVVPRWFVVLMSLIVIALTAALLTREASRHVQIRFAADERGIPELLPTIAGATQGALTEGNSGTVLQNGEFFEALLTDIEAASGSIHFETYIWWESAIAQQLAAAFIRKAQQGVVVRVLVDGSGSSRGDGELFDQMRDAGVHFERYHPFHLGTIGRWNRRDHRKIAVIDGRIGYVSGHGVGDEWTGYAQDRDHWRDTAIRVRGPIVQQLQSIFSENWIETTGEVPAGDVFFPDAASEGDSVMHVAFSSAAQAVSSVELLYMMGIVAAKKEILIQNPYFLPDRDVLEQLGAAVERGVRVVLMLPSVEVNDNAIVQHGSHHRYGFLLERGIEIVEYEATLLHQKVMVVDGVWSAIGSSNFDDRSFEINDEITLAVLDTAIASELRQAFAEDLKSAKRITPEGWRKQRSLWHRLIDGGAFLMKEQL